jgi:hypothetical protein
LQRNKERRNITISTVSHISKESNRGENYGLITKDNRPIEFETEQAARKWASNIEYKRV